MYSRRSGRVANTVGTPFTRPLAELLLAISLASAQTQAPVRPSEQPQTTEQTQTTEQSQTAERPVSGTNYLDIVARYRAGEFGEAVEALASHHEAHTPAFVTEQLAPSAIARSPVLPAAAVLHLETGHALLQKGDEECGLGHLLAAQRIVDSEWWTVVPKAMPERVGHYERVRREIYLGIIFTLQQHQQFEMLLPLLERARQQFPKDADILLALGTLNELRATAIMLRRIEIPAKQNPGANWRRQQRREYLDKAAGHFRDALTIDATLAEARVRLGRVLKERGKLPEARRELEAAVATIATSPSSPSSPPAFVDYLGTLFLGEVIESQGDVAGAIARYREAVTRGPECQSAHLALSRAFEATGDRQAALTALQPLWRGEADRKCIDPWWQYNAGQSWRMRGFIEELRASVKDKS
jgi:tetratricopeptide (TPR) repeat protein